MATSEKSSIAQDPRNDYVQADSSKVLLSFCALQVLFWLGIEGLLATHGAEVVGLTLVLRSRYRCLFITLHSANRILSHLYHLLVLALTSILPILPSHHAAPTTHMVTHRTAPAIGTPIF